jgi:hypothetical protein
MIDPILKEMYAIKDANGRKTWAILAKEIREGQAREVATGRRVITLTPSATPKRVRKRKILRVSTKRSQLTTGFGFFR